MKLIRKVLYGVVTSSGEVTTLFVFTIGHFEVGHFDSQ